jgi:hypothetical protein
MAKEEKTLEQLRDMINSVIRNSVKLDDVTAGMPVMHEPDAQGANWNIGDWTGPAALIEKAKEELAPKLREFRTRFTAIRESEEDSGDGEDDWPSR